MTTRKLIEAAIVLVFFRHVQGAARAFKIVAEEGTPPALRLFPLAMGFALYRVFLGPFHPEFLLPGTLALAGSLLLFEWARHSIRGKFFSYAMSHDTPQFLWTSGPYAHIRNPFYASYLLAYAAVAILFPELATLGIFLAMIVYFSKIARHEERKFRGSLLASEYEVYFCRTGRFIPRIRTTQGADSAKEA